MSGVSIIFLNGPSSAGKTTLGRVLQSALSLPYFYLSSDQLIESNVLPRLDEHLDEGDWNWQTIRPHFFNGFHRCVAGFATAGNSLIVEHVLEHKSWLAECVQLLAPFDVFFVGVHCPLEELERRERERGNRTVGEGRSHLEDGVHTWGPYDLEVDTFLHSPEENAQLILKSFAVKPSPSAFHQMLAQQGYQAPSFSCCVALCSRQSASNWSTNPARTSKPPCQKFASLKLIST